MTAVNENGIPDELKRHKQWVAWRYEQVEPPPKKPTKVPYSAITGRMASSVDRLSSVSYTHLTLPTKRIV